jgi:CRP/FNR family transcriptional regulator, cyclic AMP receptor protein
MYAPQSILRKQEAPCPEDFLGPFAAANVITLQPGQELFKKGDARQYMYLVKSGEVQINSGNQVFEPVTVGGILGKMALISNEPRGATARAVVESIVVPIDQRRFNFMTSQTPFFALRVMKVLSARIRAMNEALTSKSK